MKTLLLFVLIFALDPSSHGSSVVFAPLSEVLADCEKEYPRLADELLHAIRSQARSPNDARLRARLELLDDIVTSINTKQIIEVRRALNAAKDGTEIIFALELLNDTIMKSRQIFDRLIIEAATNKTLDLNEGLFSRIHSFWQNVDYYQSSFERELKQRRLQNHKSTDSR